MRILTYSFPLETSEQFHAILSNFGNKSHQSLSDVIGRNLAKAVKSAHTPSPFRPKQTGFGGPDVLLSDTYISNNGVLILELEKVRPNQALGFLANLGDFKEHLALKATAIADNIDICEDILCEIGTHHFSTTGGLFPVTYDPIERQFVRSYQKIFESRIKDVKNVVEFQWASYEPDELFVAKLLCNEKFRSFAIRLAQNKYLEESQTDASLAALGSSEDVKSYLVKNSFFEKKTIIECRKSQTRLATIDGSVEDLTSTNIRCGNCNRLYIEEKIASAISIGDKLKKLTDKSTWLTIFVTHKLNELGIPNEFIAWNIQFGADEIDIAAWIDGTMWIFELKDDEFSYNHAHIFNHRRSIINPIQSIIITTKFVSPDAMDVFSASEAATKTLGMQSHIYHPPIIIEGTNNISTQLGNYISAISSALSRWHIRRGVQGVDDAVADIISQKFS